MTRPILDMMLNRRRLLSIDRKLPLLASGLVLLTVAALGWTAYVLFERVLLDRAARRLVTSARIVSQIIQRPRVHDPIGLAADRALIEYLRGTRTVTRDSAAAALQAAQNRRDSTNFHTTLLDPSGRTLIDAHRGSLGEPSWAARAVARGAVRGDALLFGPIEEVGGAPVFSVLYALRDSAARDTTTLGYVSQSWAVSSGRNARFIRDMIGAGVTMVVGQPEEGAWTDLETIVPRPPLAAMRDTIADVDGSLAAMWPIAATNWVVWLAQSKHDVLAPTRTLLWTMFPIGGLIALVGAMLMWRIARRIAHPIVQLTQAVEGVAQDTSIMPRTADLAVPSRYDEVARLRLAFERMSLRLADREALEMQLRHAQKMEAVGRLAGGIAHDFNNLLTAIRSYADLMIEDMPQWDAKRADVEEIRKAARRASDLTAQLLAFSRKQMLQPRVLDTAAVLTDMQTMLRALLVEDITLTLRSAADLWPVRADRGQLEQVIVNLAVNARDAMPQGGALRIVASNEVVSTAIESRHGAVPPGEYVAIRLTDTGTGMDEMTQSRAFEPFFTTKAVGAGTGLGLATVHGIVAQSGGHLTLDSRVGAGSTFTVYLPREREAQKPARVSGGSAVNVSGHNETVLLVEDEVAVRSLARRVLVRAGFRVLDSGSPNEALLLARENAGQISLILTDVVMPELSGPALVAKLRDVCPRARVLYVSGYTDNEVIERGLASPEMELLQKPFSAQQLVERVRMALDAAVPAR